MAATIVEKINKNGNGERSAKGPSTSHHRVERRSKPRIYFPFPATVRGVNASGEVFEIGASLDNLSASGFYLRMPECVEQGTKLFVLTRLATSMLVAIRGRALRVEPQPDGMCGVAVAIIRYRIL